jgi:hypothetical protein
MPLPFYLKATRAYKGSTQTQRSTRQGSKGCKLIIQTNVDYIKIGKIF